MHQRHYSSAHIVKIMKFDSGTFDPEIFALFLEHRKFFMALERRKYEEARKNENSSN